MASPLASLSSKGLKQLRNGLTIVKIGLSCNLVLASCVRGFYAIPSLQFPFHGVPETDHLT